MEKNIFKKIKNFNFSKNNNFEKNRKNRKISILKKFECEFWKMEIFSKLSCFRNVWFFEMLCFFENIFSPWWKTIFCSDFFWDQVCISSNSRNHLEHLPCPHGDSEPPTRAQCFTKISQIPRFSFHNYVHPQELSIVFVKIWGCLSSNGPIFELRRSWMTKWWL